MDKPLLVEIIAYAPTAYYHCTHCEVAWREMGASNRIHEEQMENSLPGDLAEDYQAISDWVRDIFRRYCDDIIVKVIDAASPEGFIKSLRYRVRRYPAIVVDRHTRFTNEQLSGAEAELERLLSERQPASP